MDFWPSYCMVATTEPRPAAWSLAALLQLGWPIAGGRISGIGGTDFVIPGKGALAERRLPPAALVASWPCTTMVGLSSAGGVRRPILTGARGAQVAAHTGSGRRPARSGAFEGVESNQKRRREAAAHLPGASSGSFQERRSPLCPSTGQSRWTGVGLAGRISFSFSFTEKLPELYLNYMFISL